MTGFQTIEYNGVKIAVNKKRKICVLDNVEDSLKNIKHLKKKFPGFILWTCFELSSPDFLEKIDNFIDHGFGFPYVTHLSPLFVALRKPCLALSLIAGEKQKYSRDMIKIKVRSLIDQGDDCSMHVKLTENAISILKKFPEKDEKSSMKKERGKLAQKEVTGTFYVKNVSYENGKYLYTFDLKKNSITLGKIDSVDVPSDRYNFHTHPYEAYVQYTVKIAWPSLTDFLGYKGLGKSTIFHCVSTLEGVYVMSFSPETKRIKSIPDSFIRKNFNFDRRDKSITPEIFVEKVNEIKYQGKQIFFLQFLPWENAGDVFHINYPKIKNVCLPTQEIKDMYAKTMSEKEEDETSVIMDSLDN
jgi:hypothetical protein